MKTRFNLEMVVGMDLIETDGYINIIGKNPRIPPYVSIDINGINSVFIKDKELEEFAVNILKALKSDKLK